MSAPFRRLRLAPLLLLLAAIGGGSRWSAAVTPPAATAVPALAATAADRPLPPTYSVAAELARSQGFDAAFATLEPLLAGDPGEASRARVVAGLLAHSAGRPARARELLIAGAGPRELEDWRLAALAASAAALGDRTAARQAGERLLAETPDSPLRATALLRLAELAWSERDSAVALAWVEQARAERLADRDPAAETALERLAWTIGRERQLPDVTREAGRRLLVEAPLEASRLNVAATLAMPPGGGDWRTLLSPAELLARSEALLRLELPAEALQTLAALPAELRQLRWRLAEAAALTALGRGREGLAILADAAAQAGDEQAELALARAHAANEAATVVRGRKNPPHHERQALRGTAREALVAAAASAQSTALAARALRELYATQNEEDRFEESLATLRRLRVVAPRESPGARPLWERGWREFRAANYSGAIGYWSVLGELYPANSQARSAQYWTARAFDLLGEKARADAAYRALAGAATTDFYARQAGARLAGTPITILAEDEAAREPWPSDPLAERARWLSDVGLDALAAEELERIAPRLEPRALAALRALILARRGERRESLRALRSAFPQLATVHQQSVPRLGLELYYPRAYDAAVRRAAAAQQLPAHLVFGIVHQESGFDPTARSRAGARGLMQIMPATGRELARRMKLPYSLQRLHDPDYSLRLGTTYFRQMLATFDNQLELALAGYNGGPGRIQRLWQQQGPARQVDLFLEDLSLAESRNYVKRILLLAESYRSLYSDLG